MIRLKEQSKDDSICVDDMKDGDVGVVTSWAILTYVGQIVQRYGKSLVALGNVKDRRMYRGFLVVWKVWPNYFPSHNRVEECRVRLLKSGETLVVE